MTTAAQVDPRGLYLDLMERCLVNTIYEDAPTDDFSKGNFRLDRRLEGLDWPSVAHSMIGAHRMRNVRLCVEAVLGDGIPGHLIETGVWRGGTCIFMRAILKAHGDDTRLVFVADSFQGLPEPDPERYPADAGDTHHAQAHLAIPMEEVGRNFERYGLLDDQVVFLPGWFKDTLPQLAGERFAVIRLDGDMYQSTMDALDNLYHLLSPGGFTIIDDYSLAGCREAVTDFRDAHRIVEPILPIDRMGVFWRKEF